MLYKHIDRVAIGLTVGPTLAKMYSYVVRKKLSLENYPPELKPVVYRRYVNNIFVLFKSKDHLLDRSFAK